MSVTAAEGTPVRTTSVRRAPRTYVPSIELAGVLIVLVGAWGGIVPFVGPVFGFSGDGSASWTWNLPHVLLNLIPGAVAVFAGLMVMMVGPARRMRGALNLGGLLAVVCGAWFVIGPVAWPVLEHNDNVFVSASPLHELAYWVGYSLGPGLLLAALGAFVLGRPTPSVVRAERGVAGDVAPSRAVPQRVDAGEVAPSGTVSEEVPERRSEADDATPSRADAAVTQAEPPPERVQDEVPPERVVTPE